MNPLARAATMKERWNWGKNRLNGAAHLARFLNQGGM
jgi:hypothetical protein